MTNYRLNDLESETVVMKNPDEPTQRKRKRYLEVLSLTCTTIGINMALACFCGAPDTFGFQSEVFLKCTFAFFMASIFLGILAMISCIKGYEFLQTSFVPSLKKSSLFSLLKAVHLPSTNIQTSTNTNAEIDKKLLPTAEISEVIENNQIASKFLDISSRLKPEENGFPQGSLKESYFNPLNSPREGIVFRSSRSKCCKDMNAISETVSSRTHGNHFPITSSETNSNRRRSPIYSGNSLLFREYGVSVKPQGHRFTSSQRNNKQLKAKNVLQLKKRQNTVLFGQVYAADCFGSVKGPIPFSCEVERNNKIGRLNKFLKESFANKVGVVEEQFANQSHPSEMSANKIQTGTVSYGVENACFQGYNSQDRLLPFTKKCHVPLSDKVSDVAIKLNEMNFLS